MSSPPATTPPAVFLSYAREDADAARRIADALRAFGVEVWFDQHELRGGDAWDTKIKKQIRECALFVPIVSASTESRHEGYFRREWKFAVERTHDMAASRAFLLPVVIDDTREGDAEVPEEFMRVQWTRLENGVPTPEFVAQIRRLLDAPRRAAEAGRTRPAERNEGVASAPASANSSGAKQRAPLVLSAAVGAAAAVGLFVWFGASKSANPVTGAAGATPASARPAAPAAGAPIPVAATATADEKSVAVLPFANLDRDKDSEYFSDGLTEEILNALARDPALRVAGRTSSFSFKGKNVPVEEIGRALRAAKIIDGSVRKSGSRVRITVQLINAADGYQIWSEQYSRELTDIFAVQEEIAAQIAQKLGPAKPAASTGQVAQGGTKNLAAYDAYLRGRAAQTSGFSEQLIAETIRHFEAAVRLDPHYALAWARLAEAYARVRNSGYDRGSALKTQGMEAALTALRLAPDLPEAHLSRALVAQVLELNLDAAQNALDRVQQLRPNDADLPAALARLERSRAGRSERLVQLAFRAVEADPQNADNLVVMAGFLGECGRYADADRLCDRAWGLQQVAEDPLRVKVINLLAWTGDVAAALAVLEQTPESVREVRYYYRRGDLRLAQGNDAAAEADYIRARRMVAERFANRSGPRHVSGMVLLRTGQMYQRRGDVAAANQRFAEALVEADALQKDYPDSTSYAALRAIVHAALGQRAAAMSALDDVVRLGATETVWFREYRLERRAAVLSLLGEKEGAIAELRALHDGGYPFGYTLRISHDYAGLRGHPKFEQLMKEAEARANAQPRPKK